MNRTPYIFGFDNVEFVKLIDLDFLNASITAVDPEVKTIVIQIVTPVDDRTDPRTLFINRTYKWDNTTNRYETLSETMETKRYRWNRDTEKYEEYCEVSTY